MSKRSENYEVSDLDVEELNVTSSVLFAGAHHLGKYCHNDFKKFMQARHESKDPRTVLAENRQVGGLTPNLDQWCLKG